MFGLFKRAKPPVNTTASKVEPSDKYLRLKTKFKNETELSDYLYTELAKMRDRMDVLNQNLSDQRLDVQGIDRGAREYLANRYRVFTINDWRNAMQQADQPWNRSFRSSWVELFDIFFNLLQDTQVQAAVDTIVEGVLSMNYRITVNGKADEEATKLFKRSWFEDWVRINVDNKLFGFGLTQIQEYDPETQKIVVRAVNRKHIRPDFNAIVREQYDQTPWRDWSKAPWKDTTIFKFNAKLGKLNPAARWYIYKTEVARFWARFTDVMADPKIVAKTSIEDETRKGNLKTMLESFKRTNWLIIDETDEIMPFDSSSAGAGQAYFENFIRLCDEQIGVSLLGSKLVLDEGSSRSLGEVHQGNTSNFQTSYARQIEYQTNEELIPRLIKMGVPLPEGAMLEYYEEDKTTMLEKAQTIDTISKTYKVTPETASEYIGIDLEEKETPEQLEGFNGQNGQDGQNEPDLPRPLEEMVQDYKKRMLG